MKLSIGGVAAMERESIKTLLYEKYIRPTEHRTSRAIGIEIEMPVVNLNGQATDFQVARNAAKALYAQYGFEPVGIDGEGNCYSATDPVTGDNLSFDCSYNNMELSFGKEQDLRVLDRRFRAYVSFLNQQLGQQGHCLTGMGINPNKSVNHNTFIPVERYQMLQRYLSKCQTWEAPMYFHPYADFGAFASASQVQLDVEKEHLISTLQAFSLVEPVKAVLFSNSYLPSEPQLLCVRDMLWENSTHGINPHNVGMFDDGPKSIDELLEYIASTSIFCAERGTKYLHFRPIPIVEYLNRDWVDGEYLENGEYKTLRFHPEPSDLKYLRTYKFEDLTYRGTIEFRSVCCQPFRDAMTVAAFHMGLMDRTEELTALMQQDRMLYHHGYNPTELRKMMNRRAWPGFVDRPGLKKLCIQVLDLAAEGLKAQKLGGEQFLAPLYRRAENLMSPARQMVEQLEQGTPMTDIVLDYSQV
jgi:gamma-glutamylcysteine synthetase